MNGWATLWKWMFFLGASGFGLMSVWVTIAGVGDIKRMFAELKKGKE